MTPLALIPLAVGLAFLLGGLLRIDARLLALSVPPILFACMEIIGRLHPNTTPWAVQRTLSRHRVQEHEEINVSTTVTRLHPAAHRAGWAYILDPLPPGAKRVVGENLAIRRPRAGPAVRLAYTIKLPRGKHSFPAVQVLQWSLGGLMLRCHSVPDSSHVVATPRTEPLGHIPIRPRRTRAFAGPVKARRGGQGLDFFGCRSYVSGDDVRRINWRAYARTGALVVNQYELEQVADVTLIVDARQHTHVKMGSEDTFDHTVRAAASLARCFLDAGNVVGLLIYGSARWVHPGVGVHQARRILDTLSVARPADFAAFEDLRNVPTRRLPAQSQLVFVSPLTHRDDAQVIAMLVEHGYAVLCLCPHARSWQQRQIPSHPSFDLAVRIAEIKRQQLLAVLSQTGAQIVEWDVAETLTVALARSFGPTFHQRSSR